LSRPKSMDEYRSKYRSTSNGRSMSSVREYDATATGPRAFSKSSDKFWSQSRTWFMSGSMTKSVFEAVYY